MKKLFLTCLVGLMAVAANAQFYVGGNLGVSYDNTKIEDDKESITTFTLSPELGYQFDDCLSAGLELGFGYANNHDANVERTRLGLSPYVRANFAQAGSVKFFAEGALFLNHDKFDDGDNEFSYNTWGAAVRPGFTVNLTDRIKMIGKATLLQYSKASKNDVDIKSWRIAVPTEVTIGVLFNI